VIHFRLGERNSLGQRFTASRETALRRKTGALTGNGFKQNFAVLDWIEASASHARRVESEDQLAMARRNRRGAEIGESLRAAEVADHGTSQKLDHGRNGRTLVLAERQHRACKGGFRIGGRLAVGIDSPAFRQLLASAAVKLQFAARCDAGCKIEHIRVFTRARPAEGKRIGAEKRLGATRRRNGRIAWAHGHGGEAFIGQRFHFRPKGSEMGAIIDDESSQTEFARPFDECRFAGFESEIGKATMGFNAHDCAVIHGQHRHGVSNHLAAFDGTQAAFDAVNAMRFAAIAFCRHDGARDRACMGVAEFGVAEGVLHEFEQFIDRNQDGVAHRDVLSCSKTSKNRSPVHKGCIHRSHPKLWFCVS